MKVLKKNCKLIIISIVTFGLFLCQAPFVRAGEHHKAPPSKPHVTKKAQTPKKVRPHIVDTTVVESAILVHCEKNRCRDIRTNEIVGSGPDGNYLAYSDTQDNRTKTTMLGSSYVMFIKPVSIK